MLSALGETINIMTLGGLALAVGILVDDATVAIENINRNLEQGKPNWSRRSSTARSRSRCPTFVSTLCICIVFVPMFLLTGVAHYLFVPLAEAVVFAMLASYFLSRTLVPTLAKYLLRNHEHMGGDVESMKGSRNPFVRIHLGFEQRFERRAPPLSRLSRSATRASRPLRADLPAVLPALARTRAVPRPRLLSLRRRRRDHAAPARAHGHAHRGDGALDGSRRPARAPGDPEERSAFDHRQHRLAGVSGINLSLQQHRHDQLRRRRRSSSALNEDHKPTADYIRELAPALPRTSFRASTFSFLPADIVSQILNFGVPAPIDIADRRARRAGQPRVREPPAREDRAACPDSSTRASSRPSDLPSICRRCRSHQGAAGGLHAARRREQPADHALRQPADDADLLAQSGQRRELQRRSPSSAAIRHGFAAIGARTSR